MIMLIVYSELRSVTKILFQHIIHKNIFFTEPMMRTNEIKKRKKNAFSILNFDDFPTWYLIFHQKKENKKLKIFQHQEQDCDDMHSSIPVNKLDKIKLN